MWELYVPESYCLFSHLSHLYAVHGLPFCPFPFTKY